MNYSNIVFNLKRPFVNLTKRARVLQICRFITGFLGIVWLLFIVAGAFTNTGLYTNRLDCAHVNVANGLFTMLRENVSSNSESLADNYGPGLTASEIELLSAYTEKNVEKCPQYIKSNIFNWCFGNYNLTEETGSHGVSHYAKIFTYEYCTKHDKNYVYDYRGELKVIGLNIILAYAYDDNSVTTTVSNDNYMPDEAYLKKLKARRKLSKASSTLMITAGFLDLALLLFALWMYGSRGYSKDDSGAPMLFRQLIPIISLVSFISIAMGVGATTAMSIAIRNEIRNELGNFGISSHLGSAWFSMAWIGVAIHFVNACAWGGPVWCGVSTTPIRMAEADDADYVGTPMFNRTRTFHFQSKLNDINYDNEDDYEMQEGLSQDPFTDQSSKLEQKAGPFDDELYEEIESSDDAEELQASSSSKRKNLKGFLRKNNLKRQMKKNEREEEDRFIQGLNEDEFVSSDMFLTEDDRFIMKRENLYLDGSGKIPK